MYLLCGLTYSFARCTFGVLLSGQSVLSWLLRTRAADVNRFITLLNSLVAKILLILRLREIWNNNLIDEKTQKKALANGLIILIFLISSHTHSIFHHGRYVYRNWFLIRLMVKISWGPGRLWRKYNTWSTNSSYFSDCDDCDDSLHIFRVRFRSASPSPWLLAEDNASF